MGQHKIDVKVFALEPGTYVIDRIDAEFSSRGFRSKRSMPNMPGRSSVGIRDIRYRKTFTIKPGQMAYIGDVTGRSCFRGLRSASFGFKIFDRYKRDVKQLKEKYPAFRELEILRPFGKKGGAVSPGKPDLFLP